MIKLWSYTFAVALCIAVIALFQSSYIEEELLAFIPTVPITLMIVKEPLTPI